jgi:hypothetical protein
MDNVKKVNYSTTFITLDCIVLNYGTVLSGKGYQRFGRT